MLLKVKSNEEGYVYCCDLMTMIDVMKNVRLYTMDKLHLRRWFWYWVLVFFFFRMVLL